MTKRVRYAKARIRPEVFGLSTLDTVTCALAGSIVLMIIMARATVPGADVQLTPFREIFQVGEGTPTLSEQGFEVSKSALEPINPVVLYLYYRQTGRKFPSVKMTGCRGAVRAKPMRSAAGHFKNDGIDKTVAIAVFRDINKSAPSDCKEFELELQDFSGSDACDTTMVSGAHVQFREFSTCPTRFRFKRRGNDDVFVMSRAGAP